MCRRIAGWRVLVVVAVFSMGFGCGGSAHQQGGNGGDSGGGTGGGIPVTLSSLSEAERQEFEAWKQRPLKSCSWYEALPQLANVYPDANGLPYAAAEPKIDVNRFVEHIQGTSGGLPILKGPQGELVMFEKPKAASSYEVCDRSSSRVVNGQGTEFEVKSHRDNGECVITLGGEEIFRGFLADQIPAALGYDPNQAPGEAAKVGKVQMQRIDYEIDDIPCGAERINGTPLVSNALKMLIPSDKTLGFLAEHLGITAAQAKSLFQPLEGNTFEPGSAALLSTVLADSTTVDLSKTTYFAPGQWAYIYDSSTVAEGSGVLDKLRTPGTVQLDLFYVPLIGPAEKLIRLETTVAITSPSGTEDPMAQLTSIQLGAAKPRTDADAVSCFENRYLAFGARSTSNKIVYREYRENYDPCRILSPDATGALASDQESIDDVVAEVGSRLDGALDYRGWDGALIDLVDSLLTRGKPLSALHPDSQFPNLSARTTDLTNYLGAVTDAGAKGALQRPLVVLSYDSYFFNDRPMTDAQHSDVLTALKKASQPFLDSTAQMLNDLVASDRANGFAAAACGANLDDTRIAAIQQNIAGAQSYTYGAKFANRLRGAALQACYTQTDLDAIAVAVSAASAFTVEEGNRPHGASFEHYHQAFVDRALDERWTTDVFRQVEDVVGFAVESQGTTCAVYQSVSEQAQCSIAMIGSSHTDWISAAAGSGLDPKFAGRYAVLARDLRARFADQLTESGDFTVRYDIASAYFGSGGMWRDCQESDFTIKRNALFNLLDQRKTVSSIDQRLKIEQDIKSLVNSSCTGGVQ